ncbi:MAG TPA: Ni/Fe-hydrogenase, b-type cytochrome subunit [Ktedonobacterales bacterium]
MSAQETSAPHASPIAEGAEARETLYVWDLLVRIAHWLNVLSIVVLSVTGYYIASPFITTQGAATDNFLMGAIRFTHFLFAFIFTVTVLFRIYWALAGNRWAGWRQFIPTSRKRLRALGRMGRYYAFLRPRPPAVVGHNPLAGAAYTAIYVVFAIQIATGFSLYVLPDHTGVLLWLFGWITAIFGVQPVRLVHDLAMWVIIAFTIHHVYSAVLIDIEERSGLVSSIVTGYKSLTPEHIAEARENDAGAGRATIHEQERG